MGNSASAAENPKPIPFGRYELVLGQENPVCLAVGEQIKDYRKIPDKLRPHQSGTWGQDLSFLDKVDSRCDFPLENKGEISVPDWKPFDPTSAPRRNSTRAEEVFNGFLVGYKPWDRGPLPDGVDLDKREEIIRSARYPLLDQLTAWGVIRFQTATMTMKDRGPQLFYRFSNPPNTLQNCWTIGFDRDSVLYNLRFIEFRIAQVFQFENDTYYVTGPTYLGKFINDKVDIRIASFDRLAAVEFAADSPDFITDQVPITPDFGDPSVPSNTCEFNLRAREERSPLF